MSIASKQICGSCQLESEQIQILKCSHLVCPVCFLDYQENNISGCVECGEKVESIIPDTNNSIYRKLLIQAIQGVVYPSVVNVVTFEQLNFWIQGRSVVPQWYKTALKTFLANEDSIRIRNQRLENIQQLIKSISDSSSIQFLEKIYLLTQQPIDLAIEPIQLPKCSIGEIYIFNRDYESLTPENGTVIDIAGCTDISWDGEQTFSNSTISCINSRNWLRDSRLSGAKLACFGNRCVICIDQVNIQIYDLLLDRIRDRPLYNLYLGMEIFYHLAADQDFIYLMVGTILTKFNYQLDIIQNIHCPMIGNIVPGVKYVYITSPNRVIILNRETLEVYEDISMMDRLAITHHCGFLFDHQDQLLIKYSNQKLTLFTDEGDFVLQTTCNYNGRLMADHQGRLYDVTDGQIIMF